MKNYDWENQANTTQRLATLKRNLKPSYSNGVQEQLINHMARARLLQNQLFAEKMKCQTLQRKNIQYIETIAQLEYSLGDLKFMLDRADVEIKRHTQIDKQIQTYAFNLKQVGQELTALNEVLQKKNKQCQKLIQANFKLKQENNILEKKEKENENQKQLQKAKMRSLVQLAMNDSEPSFNQDLLRNMELVQDGIHDLKQNLAHTRQALEKCRKQGSQLSIKQREKTIQLEYSLKLAQKRNEDLEKKKNMQSSFTIDKRVQDMIQEMLKKQDQLSIQLSNLQSQNEILKEQLQSQKESNAYYINIKQNQYEKEIKQSKQLIKQLLYEKQSLREKLQQLTNIKQLETNRSISQELQLNKKYRESNDQNKRLKLKINELQSDKKMLQKQLNIRSFD